MYNGRLRDGCHNRMLLLLLLLLLLSAAVQPHVVQDDLHVPLDLLLGHRLEAGHGGGRGRGLVAPEVLGEEVKVGRGVALLVRDFVLLLLALINWGNKHTYHVAHDCPASERP